MSKQTSIEWLIEQCPRINTIASLELIEQAKAMHKEEIVKAFGYEVIDGEQYYQETYGSSPKEISDESWEGCDGCTEQDEVMYKNGYVKGYNAAIAELPKEISDDEIGKGCDENIPLDEADMWPERLYFRIGAKWYREQLKGGNK